MSSRWKDVNVLDDDTLRTVFGLNDNAIQYLNYKNYKVFVFDWKYYQIMKVGRGYVTAIMTKKQFKDFNKQNFNNVKQEAISQEAK